MNRKRLSLELKSCCGLAALGIMCVGTQAGAATQPVANGATVNQPATTSNLDHPDGEIVVTAQKREERINDVGMSINAVSGAQLTSRGIQDPTQLAKVVPGFVYDTTVFGNPIFSIRGVGFQDSTLGASPTVTTYVDEVPIPFSAETNGVILDIARLEVLKGPQGTLYGENATGGALNFITAKPTSQFLAGLDASYGRFSTADVAGFVSGPLSSTLKARASLRYINSGPWQKSYTRNDELGRQRMAQGRLALDWTPSSRLRVGLSASAWRDTSESAAPQLIAVVGLGGSAFNPLLNTYPLAPENDRAADWDAGRDYRRNNRFVMGTARIDYDVTDAFTFTSLTSIQRYKRDQPIEADGTSLQDLFLTSTGKINTFYQEGRLAGTFGRNHLVVGVNYQRDTIRDDFFQEFADSSSRLILGLPLTESIIYTKQKVDTYSLFASADFALTNTLQLQGGGRYTQSNRSFEGCGRDSNGELAAVYNFLRFLVTGGPVSQIPTGGCTTLNLATFNPELAHLELDEDNVSWRAGLNWKVTPKTLLYANISRGYKAGSYPTLAASTNDQFVPVKQESLLAYEAGFKTNIASQLQLNGAAFYYDYTDKQILGRTPVPIFGPLLVLVNVPKSHIVGAELEAIWNPVRGLTIRGDGTYVKSRIDGNFVNYNSFGVLQNFTGEAFPYTPKFQGNVDAEYKWGVGDRLQAFVGGNVSHHSKTNGAVGNFDILRVDPYTLLDLRAGVGDPGGKWTFSLWGRNVTNKYYWVTAVRDNDTINRYTGMPATFGMTLQLRTR